MTKSQIVLKLLNKIRSKTPVDTGNLKASTKQKRIDKNTYVIYINAGDDPYAKYDRGLAPYVPFVNEKWISSFWGGKTNPNEGYWNKAIISAMTELAMELQGELKND